MTISKTLNNNRHPLPSKGQELANSNYPVWRSVQEYFDNFEDLMNLGAVNRSLYSYSVRIHPKELPASLGVAQGGSLATETHYKFSRAALVINKWDKEETLLEDDASAILELIAWTKSCADGTPHSSSNVQINKEQILNTLSQCCDIALQEVQDQAAFSLLQGLNNWISNRTSFSQPGLLKATELSEYQNTIQRILEIRKKRHLVAACASHVIKKVSTYPLIRARPALQKFVAQQSSIRVRPALEQFLGQEPLSPEEQGIIKEWLPAPSASNNLNISYDKVLAHLLSLFEQLKAKAPYERHVFMQYLENIVSALPGKIKQFLCYSESERNLIAQVKSNYERSQKEYPLSKIQWPVLLTPGEKALLKSLITNNIPQNATIVGDLWTRVVTFADCLPKISLGDAVISHLHHLNNGDPTRMILWPAPHLSTGLLMHVAGVLIDKLDEKKRNPQETTFLNSNLLLQGPHFLNASRNLLKSLTKDEQDAIISYFTVSNNNAYPSFDSLARVRCARNFIMDAMAFTCNTLAPAAEKASDPKIREQYEAFSDWLATLFEKKLIPPAHTKQIFNFPQISKSSLQVRLFSRLISWKNLNKSPSFTRELFFIPPDKNLQKKELEKRYAATLYTLCTLLWPTGNFETLPTFITPGAPVDILPTLIPPVASTETPVKEMLMWTFSSNNFEINKSSFLYCKQLLRSLNFSKEEIAAGQAAFLEEINQQQPPYPHKAALHTFLSSMPIE